MSGRRVIIVGLDSAPPEMLFDRMLPHMPTVAKMIETGLHGPLRSCDPPITVPAWQVMSTSASPGRLGLYGFRHRKGHTYDEAWTPNSLSIREPTIWDLTGRAGLQSCLVGVPPGYPPKPVRGWSIACFLTPPGSARYTHPPDLRGEVEALVGDYEFDVPFRVEDRDAIRDGLFRMTRKRFDVVTHLAATKPWDFFMMVEIGVDRLHHAFWKFFDPEHPRHEPGNRFQHIAADYYRLIDERLAELIDVIGDAVVLVVSDHGSKRMAGALCINQWLIERGWLTLAEHPSVPTPLDQVQVDWARTRAWGWGGYYARIFLNVAGREPAGVIPPERYDAVRADLERELREITDDRGQLMTVAVHRPESLFPQARGDRPDLMVYLNELDWRSAGTVGHPSMYLTENDTGPDDSVHAMDGVFLMWDPLRRYGQQVRDIGLLDVAPSVLTLLGVEVPDAMEGRVITQVLPSVTRPSG